MTPKEQYRILCARPGDLPVFLKDWWLDAAGVQWDVAIACNGERIGAVWPYVREQKMGVSLSRNPVLTPYLGPHIFFPADLKPSKRDAFESEMLAALYEQLPDIKVWALALQPAFRQAGFFKSKGFEVQARQTFLLPLQDTEAAIFQRLHEDYRRNIRRAEQETVISEDDTALQQLLGYQQSTLARKELRLHFGWQHMQRVFAACRQHDCTTVFTAAANGVTQAIVWMIWDGSRAYYIMGGKSPDSKDNRAMTALLWQAIKKSRELGLPCFDFEGSMDPGVERFFRNFGGTRELYLTIRRNNSLLWKLKELF